MTGVARITKLDFFIMKSQAISYFSLVAVILLFGLIGSSITVLCITGAWFIALMATNIFAIQEKNHLDRLYGSVCVSLNEVVLGRYTFVFLNVSVGKNIVTGLWSGVSSMISWVKNKISGFVGDIVGGIKSLLGIHSPSRVFAGIGDNMAKGLGEGFTDEMDKVSKDINNAIPTDFDRLLRPRSF